MAVQLDRYNISILRALLKDGRKSFRKISRENSITTPTVKARFNRLVNVGFIKSVSPILDFNLVEENCDIKELEKKNGDSKSITSDANGREQYQQYLRF
jgi:DNA-binding Lrp family transcriptional regulator